MDRAEHISIEPALALAADELDGCDFSFDIVWELNAPYQDLLDLRALPARRKDYGFDPAGWARGASGRTALFRATAGERLAGFVAIEESWNGMAEIADLAVDRHCRRQGIGQFLLAAAEAWARSHGFGFMRLETQANNVAACSTYARAGFVLGGHDRFLYADGENAGEVALFWYKDLRDGQTTRSRSVDPASVQPVR
ncbi:GNAT family N-acetyltransferase [Burkholderia sp. BCC0097]|uniref:GNAT family N-acetyltransferase n=1 Tax=Burkholderia sp. BCC0097 TaxID=2676289 RepID=UPI00158CC265|nr:GNAT family N-acetyltransferase [Burkholderia sp. BCC0097]